MSYQKVGQDEVNAGVPGSTDGVVASDTATVDVAVEKDTPEALLTFFGVTVCLNQPGLGLPAAFWDRLMGVIFASLVISVLVVLTPAQMAEVWYMPVVGVGAATLANAVPVGGGIVFFPFLVYFGVAGTFNAVAFGVSTQMLGNGTFGFLNWLKKDPSRIVWRAMPYAVLPSFIGSTFALFGPRVADEKAIKFMFGLFSLCVAGFVLYASANGGVHAVVAAHHGTSASGGGGGDASSARIGHGSWVVVMAGSVVGGWIVGNIGIGNAIVTFVSLTVVLGVDSHQAVPSSIIAGGWTSAYNGLIHLLWLRDVPIHLWLMVLPGVFCGAYVAPHVHTAMGTDRMLVIFGVFLTLSALHMLYVSL